MDCRLTTRVAVLLLLCVAGYHSTPISLSAASAGVEDVFHEKLQVHFAPQTPSEVLFHEVNMTNMVTALRRADSRTFPIGSNPYSVRYAVYNIIENEVTEALIEAWKSGVEVQVLMDGSQLQPNRTWNTGWLQLLKAGFKFSPTQVGLNRTEQTKLNLVGVDFKNPNALMHLKTRLFNWYNASTNANQSYVISGSLNPETAALLNNETILFSTDEGTIDSYTQKWFSVLRDKNVTNYYDYTRPVNVLFSPDPGAKPADFILEYADEEEEAIFISVYSLRDITVKTSNSTSPLTADGTEMYPPRNYTSLFDKLAYAKYRGVQVYVVTDEVQADIDPQMFFERLRNISIPVYKATNPVGQFNAMHNKNGLFGIHNFRIVTDTGNWSEDSCGSAWGPSYNDESFIFIDCYTNDKLTSSTPGHKEVDPFKPSNCQQMGIKYLSNFLGLVRLYAPQTNNTGQATYSEVHANLTASPNWWNVTVEFSVVANVTEIDASSSSDLAVVVLGTSGILNTSSTGLVLGRQNSNLDVWQSSEPVIYPLGAILEYQYGILNKTSGELVSKETELRELIVDPAPYTQPFWVFTNLPTMTLIPSDYYIVSDETTD